MLEELLNPAIYVSSPANAVLTVGVALTVLVIVYFKVLETLKKHYWIPIIMLYVTLMLFIILSYIFRGTVATYY